LRIPPTGGDFHRQSLWAERYDRELKDVFEVQDEIARSIAQALRITLSPKEEKIIASKPPKICRPMISTFAGAAMPASSAWSSHTDVRAVNRARSGFALAYAGLANVCGHTTNGARQHPRWIEKGWQPASAVWLAAEPAGIARSLRSPCLHGKEYEEACRYAEEAIQLKPDCEGVYDVLGRRCSLLAEP